MSRHPLAFTPIVIGENCVNQIVPRGTGDIFKFSWCWELSVVILAVVSILRSTRSRSVGCNVVNSLRQRRMQALTCAQTSCVASHSRALTDIHLWRRERACKCVVWAQTCHFWTQTTCLDNTELFLHRRNSKRTPEIIKYFTTRQGLQRSQRQI